MYILKKLKDLHHSVFVTQTLHQSSCLLLLSAARGFAHDVNPMNDLLKSLPLTGLLRSCRLKAVASFTESSLHLPENNYYIQRYFTEQHKLLDSIYLIAVLGEKENFALSPNS